MIFGRLWRSKSEHFAKDILQKSRFGMNENPMLKTQAFEAILEDLGFDFAPKSSQNCCREPTKKWMKFKVAFLDGAAAGWRNARTCSRCIIMHFKAFNLSLEHASPCRGRRIQSLRAFRRPMHAWMLWIVVGTGRMKDALWIKAKQGIVFCDYNHYFLLLTAAFIV